MTHVRRPMSAALLAALLAGALATPSTLARETATDEGFRQAVEIARDRVYPALVNITVVARDFVQGRERRAPGAGSGVIVSPAGHVVTNYHVAGNAARITCKMPDGESIEADILTADPLTDLCILTLRLAQRADPTKPLPFASLGDSTRLQVGDHVLAMGNPMSLSSSITLGIVSNTERVFTSFTGDRLEPLDFGRGNLTGIFNRWIQHDALILPGNSGGPLVDLRGQVIGINTRGGGGAGFAIPAHVVRKVLNQALTYGEVRRGWLGVTVDPVQHLDREDGALVSAVQPASPAARAGLQPGDVIVSVAGRPVAVPSVDHVPLFYSTVADLAPQTDARIAYDRGGEQHVALVRLDAMEKYVGEERAFRIWGVSAQTITAPMAFARAFPDTRGVLLTSIRPGGAPDAAKPALEAGDVILEIAGKAVESLAGFDDLLREHAASKALPVRFRRGKRDMVTVLDLTPKPRRRGSGELPKPWLGIATQVLTPEVAEALGLAGTKGFRVTWIMPGTEAEKAGLEVGDVLTAVDGEPIEAHRIQDAEMLRRRIEDLTIGEPAVLSVIRAGGKQEVSVLLQETPETATDVRSAEDELLEYKVRELVFTDRVERDLPGDLRAILVSEVEVGGWAGVAGLMSGDVLLEIQDRAIPDVETFKGVVAEIAEGRPKRIRIFVRRGRSTAYVFVQPDWPRN